MRKSSKDIRKTEGRQPSPSFFTLSWVGVWRACALCWEHQVRVGGLVPGTEGDLQRTVVPKPLPACWLQGRVTVKEKHGSLTPSVSHESFAEKDGAMNNFFAVHLDFSRAAKSKTSEGDMNLLVSWFLWILAFLPLESISSAYFLCLSSLHFHKRQLFPSDFEISCINNVLPLVPEPI